MNLSGFKVLNNYNENIVCLSCPDCGNSIGCWLQVGFKKFRCDFCNKLYPLNPVIGTIYKDAGAAFKYHGPNDKGGVRTELVNL